MKIEKLIADPRINGARGMLSQINKRYGGIEVDDELANMILEGVLEKSEIHRRLTSGLGIGKPHNSVEFLSKKSCVKDGRIRDH